MKTKNESFSKFIFFLILLNFSFEVRECDGQFPHFKLEALKLRGILSHLNSKNHLRRKMNPIDRITSQIESPISTPPSSVPNTSNPSVASIRSNLGSMLLQLVWDTIANEAIKERGNKMEASRLFIP